MNKGLKIGLNVLIFAIVIGFGWYMVNSVDKDEAHGDDVQLVKGQFVSPYKKNNSFDVGNDILALEIYKEKIYVVLPDSFAVYDLLGNLFNSYPIAKDARDIHIAGDKIYLLYATQIESYTLDGQKNGGWEACSNNSDYCSFAFAKQFVFVTDAANKNICQYTVEGNFVRFINSPQGFVIPSYSFDIVNVNDTIYCSNSGNRKIESYTLDGEFIHSFGKNGTEAGAFAGCCNPVYIATTDMGDILTSEKGNPRISCYSKTGKFRTVLLDSEMLGGGNEAYKIKAVNDKLYSAKGKTITEFVFAPSAAQNACADCKVDCPLRKGVDADL